MAPTEATSVEEIFDRSQIEDFFRKCIEAMKSEATRQTLKDPSSGRPGSELVRLQKCAWDDLGIDAGAGFLAISRIEDNFPDDADLATLKKQFARSVDVAYVQCLEDRRPQDLESKKEMPRQTVLEFLDACSVKFDTTQVQERLAKQIKETRKMPTLIIQQVRDEVLELLGFDPEHGQSSFRKFCESHQFAKDREAIIAYQRWQGKTDEVCLQQLNKYQVAGGELDLDDEVKGKLLELRAKEELDTMSPEERAQLLQNNAQKLSVVQGLPPNGRKRYLDRLGDEEKLELAKTGILLTTLQQFHEQAQR